MNRWSTKRKRIILTIIFAVLIVFIAVSAYLIFHRAPTCFDGKQNGDETDVDCGGSCQLLCSVESLPLIQKGDPQVLNVANNVYEVVALFENPNVNAEIYRAGYTIKLYSALSPAPVKIIEGETFIPKNTTFAIFEGPFMMEEEIPVKAIFSWQEEDLTWQKSNTALPKISIRSKDLTKAESAPRLELRVSNDALETIYNVEFIVLLSDSEGNIFAASRTFLDSLSPSDLTPAVFTWPTAFQKQVSLIDVVPRVLPDRSFIR